MTQPKPIAEAPRDKPIIGLADWGWVEMWPTHIKGLGDCWEDTYTSNCWVPELWLPVPDVREQ